MTVVTVTGAIDLATAPQLRSRLDAVPDRGTIVDLAGVTLLAAAGMTVLLDLHHRLYQAGARLVLVGAPSQVRRILAATELDTVLAMTSVITEAVELAAVPQRGLDHSAPSHLDISTCSQLGNPIARRTRAADLLDRKR